MIEVHSIDVILQFKMNSRNMEKKIINFKIFKVTKSTSEIRSGHYLLRNNLNGKFLKI